GRDTDDGVMAPVERFTELEEVHAGGEHGTVDTVGELLDARIKRVVPSRARCSLNDARVGIGFHHAHQRSQAVSGHHAVGVEHDHIAVVAPPAAAKVCDVAALALDVVLTPAVIDAAETAYRATQIEPAHRLHDPNIPV